MSDLITITSSVIPDSARVLGFHGTEALSRPYEIEIFLSLQQELVDELDLADAIGAKARLVVDRADLRHKAHSFVGVFANLEILHAYDGRILLRATLVPRLWQLGLSRHSRIFTKMSVPEIIRAVLTENGITDVEMRLGSYDKEEHVSQYRESDLDFLSRWMEREGIFYFFEHLEEGEKLVLCDSRLYDEDELGTPVRYFPQATQDRSAGQHLHTFKCRHAMRPASVRLKDYDYAKPGLNLSGAAAVTDNGTGEVSLYGERFFTPAAGDRLAKIRAEEMQARQVLFRGEGTRHHLRPGYTFELDEHPLPSFNADYLAVEARHAGNQAVSDAHLRALMEIEHDEVYRVEVDAIPAKAQFRAESRTPWPRIYGVENGIVDGPAESDYAQIDDQGRYLCKFKYDESRLKNGKATTWVRMVQPHGGDIEGFHFPLRKGTEVVFSFLGGDVDRPMIAGVVPNAVNPSPVTAQNHTKNVIQTGARNRLEIEDKAGSEWIRLSTPYAGTFINMGLAWPRHELNLGTQDNAALVAQKAYDIAVGVGEPAPSGAGNMTVHVANNLTTTVDHVDMKTTVTEGNASLDVVAGTLTETIEGDTLRHIQTGKYTVDVDTADLTTNVKTASMLTNVKTDATTTVNGNTKHRTDGTMDILSGGVMSLKTDKGSDMFLEAEHVKLTARADLHETVLGTEYAVKYADTHEITHGNSTKITYGLSTSATFGNTASLFVGASESAKLAAEASLTLGLSLQLTYAIKMALEYGVNLKINFANDISIAPFKYKTMPMSVGTIAADIYTTPTHTRLGGLVTNCASLFAVI
jgi:type VI secretion system secreted protein VgrG